MLVYSLTNFHKHQFFVNNQWIPLDYHKHNILYFKDYLEILTDQTVKDFVAINFSQYFKSIREKQNLRKVAKLLYIFLTKPMKQKNMCNQIFLIIAYVTIMSRFLIFLIQNYNWLSLNQWLEANQKKFQVSWKVQTGLVFDYKKINYHKIFHSSTKQIASDSDIDEVFKFMQSFYWMQL